MALPVTITGDVGTQNSYHGPFKSNGGAFYTILEIATDQLAAKKATDPTDSFPEQDSPNRPNLADAILSVWVFQKVDILYVVAQTVADDVYHAQFDMATDTWVEITVGNTEDLVVDQSQETQSDAVSIAVEESSSNEIVIVYQGNPGDNKDMGGSFEHVQYAVSDDAGVGASWSTGNNVADTNDASEVDFTGPVIVRGTSDRMHIFFKDDTNGDGYQRTLATPGGTPALETFPSAFDAEVLGSGNFIFGKGVLLVDTVYGVYKEDGSKLSIVNFISADVPVLTVSDDVTTGSAKIDSFTLSLDGNDLHLVYVETTDSDVWHDVNTGSGWGTDTELFSGTGAIGDTFANIYDRDGPKIAIIYVDTVIKYNEHPLTYTFGLLSDVNMGKQNSFHGPFET